MDDDAAAALVHADKAAERAGRTRWVFVKDLPMGATSHLKADGGVGNSAPASSHHGRPCDDMLASDRGFEVNSRDDPVNGASACQANHIEQADAGAADQSTPLKTFMAKSKANATDTTSSDLSGSGGIDADAGIGVFTKEALRPGDIALHEGPLLRVSRDDVDQNVWHVVEQATEQVRSPAAGVPLLRREWSCTT